MITLRPMLPEYLDSYLRHRSETYAIECVDSGFWPADRAVERAYSYIRGLVPLGIATPDHYLFTIHTEVAEVGTLWFCVQTVQGIKSAFICHVEIHEPFRRRGYAKEAFAAMEQFVLGLNVTSISLNVFTQNREAQEFYTQIGFVTPGINMVKLISKDAQ